MFTLPHLMYFLSGLLVGGFATGLFIVIKAVGLMMGDDSGEKIKPVS